MLFEENNLTTSTRISVTFSNHGIEIPTHAILGPIFNPPLAFELNFGDIISQSNGWSEQHKCGEAFLKRENLPRFKKRSDVAKITFLYYLLCPFIPSFFSTLD